MNTTISHSLALTIAVAILSCSALFAEDAGKPASKALPPDALNGLSVTLDSAQKQTLLSTGVLTRYYDNTVQTGLCPQPGAATAMIPQLNGAKPSIGIETLIVYPLPAKLSGRPDRDLVLYNLMNRFRSMEGIEYWSASRNAMRVFFTSSRLVQAPDNRATLADPSFTAIPEKHSLFLEQEDSSFGKNLYDMTMQSPSPGSVLLNMSNRDQIWYGIIPVLGPRALCMYLLAQASPDGKYLYFYGNAAINAAKAFGVEERAKTSFTNRIFALFNWYAREIETQN